MSGKKSEKQIKRFGQVEELQHRRKCHLNKEAAKIFRITVNGYSIHKTIYNFFPQ
jgi:hypothetical protein